MFLGRRSSFFSAIRLLVIDCPDSRLRFLRQFDVNSRMSRPRNLHKMQSKESVPLSAKFSRSTPLDEDPPFDLLHGFLPKKLTLPLINRCYGLFQAHFSRARIARPMIQSLSSSGRKSNSSVKCVIR